MGANMIAALMGAPLASNPALRTGAIAVFGVLLGSIFTPDLVKGALSWLPAMGLLLVFLPFCAGLSYLVLRRAGRLAPHTAYFASFPGGLGELAILASAYNAAVPMVGLVHATRIVLVVTLVPLAFNYGLGIDVPTSVPADLGSGSMGWIDAAILLACAGAGIVIGQWLGMPAPAFLGPMLLSLSAHALGLTKAAPPTPLIILAQIVLGAFIGAAFTGQPWRRLAPLIGLSAGTTLVMIAGAALLALIAAPVLPQDAVLLFLALAPGGFTEMMIIALAMGVDPAFVTAMHLLRVNLIVILAPSLLALMQRRA